jgi:hypothetical protein
VYAYKNTMNIEYSAIICYLIRDFDSDYGPPWVVAQF